MPARRSAQDTCPALGLLHRTFKRASVGRGGAARCFFLAALRLFFSVYTSWTAMQGATNSKETETDHCVGIDTDAERSIGQIN